MAKKDIHQNQKLTNAISKRGKKILERFGEIVISDVNNEELLGILKEFNNQWKDTLRPALTSFSCEAVGGQPSMADDAGLMFTLVAAGIGIHDDIIDKSQVNHFKKTILGQYGLDIALLVGDLLIVKAWTRVNDLIRKNFPSIKLADIVELYGSFSVQICEAEFSQLSCRRSLETDLGVCQKILWDAMAETEACARIGAILGNGSNEEVAVLAEFGRRLGFMYRLADEMRDCLNIEGNLAHRIENESVPLPLLFAAKSSEESYLKINSIIQKKTLNPSDVRALLKTCFETEAFVYVQSLAKENLKQATIKLSFIKPSQTRRLLMSMIEQSFKDLEDLVI